MIGDSTVYICMCACAHVYMYVCVCVYMCSWCCYCRSIIKFPSRARGKVMTGFARFPSRLDRKEEFSRRPRLADDDDDDDDEIRKCASVRRRVAFLPEEVLIPLLHRLPYTGQTNHSYSNISETATKTK